MTGPRRREWLDLVWLLAWGIASSSWCLIAQWELGPVFDEPLYLREGLEAWRTGSHAGLLRLGTMPLAIDLATLPAHAYDRWSGGPLDATADFPTVLRSARATALAFWWLLLVYATRAGRLLAGAWAGRLAVALIAVEPVLLGHAALATTDVAVTACLVAFTVHVAAGREREPLRRIVVPGVWYGLALLAKASALVFGVLCMLAVEIWRLLDPGIHDEPAQRSRPRAFARDLAAIVAVGLSVALVYCGSDWDSQPSFVAWARDLPEGRTATAMTWIAEHLRIFSNAAEGLVRQIRHAVRGHGHGAYLLGDVRESFWYYFPAALSMKVGLPLLALPVLIVLIRPVALLNWATVAAGLLLVASLASRVQIGVRFYLPLITLAAIGLSASLVHAARAQGRRGRAVLVSASVAAVMSNGVEAATLWPHGLCHVNAIWGGPLESVRLLSDSNCDWGQGLPDLAWWHEQEGGPSLDVWYFGTDPAFWRLPFNHLPLHLLPLETSDDVLERVRGRRLAVSGTLLYGTFLSEAHRHAALFLRTQRPIARTMTFFIFDFSGRPRVRE